MREIEFRAKRKDNGEWIHGYLRQTGHENIEKANGQHIRTEKYYQIQDNKYNSQFIDENTVGQYTGLKDKNGKKIFDGDIVKDQYCIYEVVYDENGYYAKVVELLQECGTQKGILYNFSDYKDLEVIGNIYDNPDLIGDDI